MARKRKLQSSKATPGASEPPQKQQHQQEEEKLVEEQSQQESVPQDPEQAQEVEQENGEGEEHHEEVKEETVNGGESNQVKLEALKAEKKDSAMVEAADEDDGDDDSIEKILEPFSKEQLIVMLCEVVETHTDVAERIRKVAEEDPVPRKIFVHGLGWETTEDTLRNEFQQYGVIEDIKNVLDKISGKCKGFAFILFKTRKGAQNALKQPQKKINNRIASCQLASVGPSAQASATRQASGEAEFTRRKIYVSNVGAELDPQKLLEFFSKYGEIEEGPLGIDKLTGKPKGFCLFVYRTVEGAKKALEEPHKNFEGHTLHCQKAVDGPKYGKGKQQQNSQNTHFQRKNPGFSGASQGHLMAPSGVGVNPGAVTAPALNPALGQALTALLSNPAANAGLHNLLGTLGAAAGFNPVMQGAAPSMQGGYSNQGMQGGYGNQPIRQGGMGRGQHGAGQFGGAGPNMRH